jgi:membrane protease YdiL (CAAX protease family)
MQACPKAIHPPLVAGNQGRFALLGGLTVFGAALVALLATGHTSIQPSPDSTARISLWTAVVPALVGMLLVWVLPPRAPVLAVPSADHDGAHRQLRVLLGIAVLMPLTWYLAALAGVDVLVVGGLWALSKPIVFLLLPWLIFRRMLNSPAALLPAVVGEILWRPKGSWRWVMPIPALAVFGYLTWINPLAGPLPHAQDYPDPVLLVVGASLTFFTANVVEELFYRVALQTRLEAALGLWPGILLTGLLFALLHLPSHGQPSSVLAGLPLTLGAITIFQGVFGLFVGYLWSRYRNVWILIAAHSIVNTFPLLLNSA